MFRLAINFQTDRVHFLFAYLVSFCDFFLFTTHTHVWPIAIRFFAGQPASACIHFWFVYEQCWHLVTRQPLFLATSWVFPKANDSDIRYCLMTNSYPWVWLHHHLGWGYRAGVDVLNETIWANVNHFENACSKRQRDTEIFIVVGKNIVIKPEN